MLTARTTYPIRFGTDGWRAVLGDGYTFENVRRCAAGLARYLLSPGRADAELYQPPVGSPSYRATFRDVRHHGVVIGYDARLLSGRFAQTTAEVLSSYGIPVFLAREISTTPSVSWAVANRKATGGVVITSSHNPPEWNGFKYKPEYGGSGSPEVMQAIEKFIEQDGSPEGSPGAITQVSLRDEYHTQIRALVDTERIRRSSLRISVDPIHGAAAGDVPALLGGGTCEVREVRGDFNPGFGGVNPEPIGKNLAVLAAACRRNRSHVGLAFDGDADRVGAMDSQGNFVNSHEIFSMLLFHLVEQRKWTGGVVKTFSTSRMVDRLAARFGLPVYEVPIGFKYIVELMLQKDILIGGEESGGIGIKHHIPERDGVLCALLLTEAMACRGVSVRGLLRHLQRIIGTWYYGREDLHLPAAGGRTAILSALREHLPSHVGGSKVLEVQELDGLKLLMEKEAWLLLRPSGTEPVIRVYSEATSRASMQEILTSGVALARDVSARVISEERRNP